MIPSITIPASVWIAAVGGVIILWGRWYKVTRTPQKHAFLWGAVLLLIAAAIDHEPVLVSFELIVSIGCVLAFLPWSQLVKAALIGLATLLVPIVVFTTGYAWLPVFMIGLIGLVISSFGYAVTSAKIQLISSFILAVYNMISWLWLGFPSASMFLLLNIIYIGFAARSLTVPLSEIPTNTLK